MRLPTYPFQRKRFNGSRNFPPSAIGCQVSDADFCRHARMRPVHPFVRPYALYHRPSLKQEQVFESFKLHRLRPAFLNQHRIFRPVHHAHTRVPEDSPAGGSHSVGKGSWWTDPYWKSRTFMSSSALFSRGMQNRSGCKPWFLQRRITAFDIRFFACPAGEAFAAVARACGMPPALSSAALVHTILRQNSQANQDRCDKQWDAAQFYEEVSSLGMDFGMSFRGLRHIWKGSGEALGEMRLPEELKPYSGFVPVPSGPTGCLFPSDRCRVSGFTAEKQAFLLIGIERFRLFDAIHRIIFGVTRA